MGGWRALAAALLTALAVPAAAEDEWGWAFLFDGKSLDGWRQAGGAWAVEDGAFAGADGACLTVAKHADFELSCEFKLDPSADAGLLLRAAGEGTSCAYEVTLGRAEGGGVGAVAPGGRKPYLAEPPKDAAAFRPDAWNHLYVRIEGKAPRIRVVLNNRKLAEVADGRSRPPAEGAVGFRVRGGKAGEAGARARVRNLRLRPLGAAEKKIVIDGDIPDNDAEVVKLGAKVYYLDRAGALIENSESAVQAPVGCRIHLDCTPKDDRNKPTMARGIPLWTYGDRSLIRVGGRSPYNPVLTALKPGVLTFTAEVDGVRSKDLQIRLTE